MNSKDKLIEELEQKIKEAQQTIEKLKKENDEWFPRVGDTVWYVQGAVLIENISHYPEIDSSVSYLKRKGYKLYKTQEEAEKEQFRVRKYLSIHSQLKSLSDKSMKGADRLNEAIDKHYIVYMINEDKFDTDAYSAFINNHIVFKSKDDAENAIKEIGEDDLKFYFGVEGD